MWDCRCCFLRATEYWDFIDYSNMDYYTSVKRKKSAYIPLLLYNYEGELFHLRLGESSLTPVSYTHLDVYKRQIFDDLPLQEIARELSNSFGATIQIADTTLQRQVVEYKLSLSPGNFIFCKMCIRDRMTAGATVTFGKQCLRQKSYPWLFYMNDFACLRTDPDNPAPSVHIAGIFDWFVYCLIISVGICQVECFQIVIFGFCNA